MILLMKRVGLAMSVSLALAGIGSFTPPLFASVSQIKSDAGSGQTPSPEATKAARSVIEEMILVSRLPEIYADFRRSLKEVTLPILRESGEGSIPGAPAPDAKTAGQIAKVMTFLDYVRRAADELDGPLAENRGAMISDAAELMAKHSNGADMTEIAKLLRLPVVRKASDAFYA
jgi:hypothetical protein